MAQMRYLLALLLIRESFVLHEGRDDVTILFRWRFSFAFALARIFGNPLLKPYLRVASLFGWSIGHIPTLCVIRFSINMPAYSLPGLLVNLFKVIYHTEIIIIIVDDLSTGLPPRKPLQPVMVQFSD